MNCLFLQTEFANNVKDASLSSYCRLLRSRYAKCNRMKYTVKASVMCVATTSLTTLPHITYQGRTILPD